MVNTKVKQALLEAVPEHTEKWRTINEIKKICGIHPYRIELLLNQYEESKIVEKVESENVTLWRKRKDINMDNPFKKE